MSTPLFSIIVATYGRPLHLAECLDALAATEFESGRFEVIVVDDGSPQPLDEVVARHRGAGHAVRLVRQANAGPGAARNAGAAVAEGSLLAFTDDDCRPAPDWLQRLEERATAAPGCMIGGRTENGLCDDLCSATSQLVSDAAYAFYNADPSDAGFFASNNMVVPTAAFKALGGFDPAFRVASEDRDLCARWRGSGRRLAYAPLARVRHLHALSLAGFTRQHFAYGRGAHRFHAARIARGGVGASAELRFHARFLALVRDELGRIGYARAVPVLALLGVWQLSNAAGFFYEAMRSRLSSTVATTPVAEDAR